MTDLIPGQWIELFKGLDVPALVMLAVVAYGLKWAESVSEGRTVTILIMAGAVWGIIQGFATYGDDMSRGQLVAFIAKGVLMNGGGSYLLAQIVWVALAKWPGKDAPPPAPQGRQP